MSRKLIGLTLVALLAIPLAGCEEQDRAQKAAIDKQLPRGCEVRYLGDYSGVRVVTIFCDGHPIQATNIRWSSGKSSRHAVILGGAP